jgi:hypothetical protein
LADIFQEVDEELRREQLRKLWEQYGNYLIALIVVVLLAVAGWRGYEWWQAKRAAEASVKFDAAAALLEQGKTAEAKAAFEALANSDAAGYRPLARLRAAAVGAGQDSKAAVGAYDAIAQDSSVDPALRELAQLNAALLLVDTAPYAEFAARAEPMAVGSSTFRHNARELLALSAWRNHDAVAAQRWFDLIASDPQTPPTIRERVDILMALSVAPLKG